MSSEHETAYPRLRSYYSRKELERFYTPNDAELALARQSTKQATARLCFLTLYKTAQHLGYFVQVSSVPKSLTRYIASCLGLTGKRVPSKDSINSYDRSGSRQRHLKVLRTALGIKPFSDGGADLMNKVALQAAERKEQTNDIINEILEELVHHYYELPAFYQINETAVHARKAVRQELFSEYSQKLTAEMKHQLNKLLQVNDKEDRYSLWNKYRRECGKPTTKVVKEYLKWLTSIKDQAERLPQLENISVTRKKALLHEARSYNAWQMRQLDQDKAYTLTALLVCQRYATALDDVADIFIRLVRQLHHKAKQNYQEHLLKHTGSTDRLVSRFHQILSAWQQQGGVDTTKVDQLLDQDTEGWICSCEQYLKLADDNYLPFLIEPYQKKRSQLFNCLGLLSLISTSQDDRLCQALEWINRIRSQRRVWLDDIPGNLSDGTWLTKTWSAAVIEKSEIDHKGHWRRTFLELATFTLIMDSLNAGDLCVESGESYKDYRDKLVSKERYQQLLPKYGQQVGLPTDPDKFVQALKTDLEQTAEFADQNFTDCQQVCFKNGRLSLSRPEAKTKSAQLADLQRMLDSKMPTMSILDLLVETEHWLGLNKFFKPPSGEPGRLADPKKRFVATLFCYGCNLGPSQTARSVRGLSRKQIAWLNIGRVSEQALDQAIVSVINAYNRFQLPKNWGTGQHAAADGTRWDVYEQNLFSEFHIRYGSYGGIGYYHISDTYAALFSHFITCGTYEGTHILDGLIKNTSDIQPNKVHGDTHAQNEPAFALAYLLGIELMPRVRHIGDRHFYRPDKHTRYDHIDSLFHESIRWPLIKQHLPDMFRVTISIQQGCIDASAILKRLGSGTRKNRLYFAFRELGRAVRTKFFLQYIMDVELRKTIHQATNKCEEFNDFCKWLMFGGDGVIAENLRHEQRKIMKYNHLVSNLVILHNVQNMSRCLKEIVDEGTELTPEILGGLSPYRRRHINRFGDYRLDMERQIPALDFNLEIPVRQQQ